MAGNSFGSHFRITTFGESHGNGVGVIVDGVPPRIELVEKDIQFHLDRRKPGQSSVTTPRAETDTVHILSGVFNGQTTGTPLAMVLYNQDTRPGDYDNLKDVFRPGHADWSYLQKYAVRDHRGSGRASGRETAARVAAGAVALKILSRKGISVTAYTLEAVGIRCGDYQPGEIENNPLRACDPVAAAEMLKEIERLKRSEESGGGIVECRIENLPPGLGEPVFDKLDADLAKAMLSIGGVKGFELGSGFTAARMRGSEHNDPMRTDGSGKPFFCSNNAGGVLGGISTGEPIVFRIPVKPTSSISRPQKTVNSNGEEVDLTIAGRHDPIICPRIVPVVEAMSGLVLADHLLRQTVYSGWYREYCAEHQSG